MSKKKQKWDGVVYSTNSDFNYSDKPKHVVKKPPPSTQDLRVWKEMRNGKPTTVIRDFVGTDEDLKALGKEMLKKCGCGGSDKDGEIILQGDVRDKVMAMLTAAGYKSKKAGG